MQIPTQFLCSIGHTERVYVRCLSPKNTPIAVLQSRGMTYTAKDGLVKKSVIEGYIDLKSGELHQRYGKDYKSVVDGWKHLLNINKQGYGIYYVVGHGGVENSDITHGTTLFHESDKLSIDQQQLTNDRITGEFGAATAVVRTQKSLHSYWAGSDVIPIDVLASYQKRWSQYSNCDDTSLSDPAQLMRLPAFDHVSWNSETNDFDHVLCELIHLNPDVRYTLDQFDKALPPLDLNLWTSRSLEAVPRDATDRDMRVLAKYLDGYKENGRDGWDTAKCPAHDGESSDSLHIDRATGGFICHAGCSSSAVYNAAKAVAVAAGHRFEAERTDTEDLTRLLQTSDYDPSSALPQNLRKLIRAESKRWTIPPIVYVSTLLAVIVSLSKVDTRLRIRETSGKPILWIGIVGTSNSGKSESLRTITSPLEALQRGANDEYEAAMVQYDRELELWEKLRKQKDSEPGDKPKEPGCREFYMDDYTYEALAHVCQYQKSRCVILKIDELKGFCEFEKYGTTNNRSRILSLYDGDGMKVNRKSSKRLHIERTGISVVGTTQYTTLSRLLEKDDNKEDGLWARFALVNLPTTPTYSHDPEYDNKLYTTLASIYATINCFDAHTFEASPQAKELWTAWYNEMVNQTTMRNDGFMESIYGKAKDRVARIALALHVLHAAAAGTSPELEISADTLHHAIELGKCLLLETEKCLALVGATTDPEEEQIIKFVTYFSGKGWIDSRSIRNWWTTKPKPSVISIVRPFMSKVVSLGYAIDNGEPVDSPKYQIQILEKSSPKSPCTPQKHSTRDLGRGLSESPEIIENIPDPISDRNFTDGLSESPPNHDEDRNSDNLRTVEQSKIDGLSGSPSPERHNIAIPITKPESDGLSSSPQSTPCTAKVSDDYGLFGLLFPSDDLKICDIPPGDDFDF